MQLRSLVKIEKVYNLPGYLRIEMNLGSATHILVLCVNNAVWSRVPGLVDWCVFGWFEAEFLSLCMQVFYVPAPSDRFGASFYMSVNIVLNWLHYLWLSQTDLPSKSHFSSIRLRDFKYLSCVLKFVSLPATRVSLTVSHSKVTWLTNSVQMITQHKSSWKHAVSCQWCLKPNHTKKQA